MGLPNGAELGATDDPKALIIGDKVAVAEHATAIDDEQRRIGTLLETIGGLAIPTWEGGLGKAGYTYEKAGVAKKFEAHRDRLKSVGARLNTYADALGTAQDRAQCAIDKWNEGEAATKKALADHNAAVEGYNRQVAEHNAAIRSGQSIPLIGFVHPGPFVDPGEALRKDAEEILKDARETLDKAGTTAATGSGDGSIERRGFQELPDDIRKKFKEAGVPGELLGGSGEVQGYKIVGDKLQLINAKGEVYVFRLEEDWEESVGEFKVAGDGKYTLYNVGGEVVGTFGKDGVKLEGSAHIHVAQGEREVKVEHGYWTGSVNAYGSIGAEVNNSLSINESGVDAGVGAFAGGKVGGGSDVTFGGFGAGLNAEAWAGAGYIADLNMSWDGGRFSLEPEAGVALGIGGTVKPNIVIDFPEIAATGKDIIQNPAQFYDNATLDPGEYVDVARDPEGLLRTFDKLQYDPIEMAHTGNRLWKRLEGSCGEFGIACTSRGRITK
ncbi:putative T7SS-secreted protein [Nocardioides sp. CCNWLW239]|uniref:WXG100 family type VII secretion target n=1 Tax=Nocardioides sp. CCNWLW239 TaxID=3128902 RepID=UPI00301AC068